MDNIYVITSGEYSEYSIHSVWSDENKANDICKLLNGSFMSYQQFQVEEYPLNRVSEYDEEGLFCVYDFGTHGYSVNVENITARKAILSSYELRTPAVVTPTDIRVKAKTLELAHKIIFDEVAQLKAKEEGLTF